jgi:hypothetical protein
VQQPSAPEQPGGSGVAATTPKPRFGLRAPEALLAKRVVLAQTIYEATKEDFVTRSAKVTYRDVADTYFLRYEVGREIGYSPNRFERTIESFLDVMKATHDTMMQMMRSLIASDGGEVEFFGTKINQLDTLIVNYYLTDAQFALEQAKMNRWYEPTGDVRSLEKVVPLLRERIKAAEQVYDEIAKPYSTGKKSASYGWEVGLWSRRLFEVECDLTDDRSVRDKALRAHLDRMVTLEKKVRALVMGESPDVAVTQIDVDVLSCYRLEAKNQLEKMKKVASPPRTSPTVPPPVSAQRQERVQLAEKVFEHLREGFKIGRHPVEIIYRFSTFWMDAQLDVSDRPSNQVKAVSEHLKRMQQAEHICDELLHDGNRNVTTIDHDRLRYYCLEAEGWLAIVKNR